MSENFQFVLTLTRLCLCLHQKPPLISPIYLYYRFLVKNDISCRYLNILLHFYLDFNKFLKSDRPLKFKEIPQYFFFDGTIKERILGVYNKF